MGVLRRKVVPMPDRDITQMLKVDTPVDLDEEPSRAPIPYPVVDNMVEQMRGITQEFGKRNYPDLPKALNDFVEQIKTAQLEALHTLIDAVEGSDQLISEVIERYNAITAKIREHETHLGRERKIAEKLGAKYRTLWKDILAEIEKEEGA